MLRYLNICKAAISKISIMKYVQQFKKKKKKNRNTPIYFNTSHRTEMKLVPVITDYVLLQFDALNFFLGVRLHGRSLPNFNFFNENPQIFRRNRKVHLTNCSETNFHNISNSQLTHFSFNFFHTTNIQEKKFPLKVSHQL